MPITPSIDKQSYISHFSDCPAAAEFRKNDRLNQIEEADRNQEALNNL